MHYHEEKRGARTQTGPVILLGADAEQQQEAKKAQYAIDIKEIPKHPALSHEFYTSRAKAYLEKCHCSNPKERADLFHYLTNIRQDCSSALSTKQYSELQRFTSMTVYLNDGCPFEFAERIVSDFKEFIEDNCAYAFAQVLNCCVIECFDEETEPLLYRERVDRQTFNQKLQVYYVNNDNIAIARLLEIQHFAGVILTLLATA